MFNPCLQVPANLVQIVDITKKDGTPLEFDDWRRKRIGIVTLCWIAGGFTCLAPFFRGRFMIKDGTVPVVDFFWRGNASTGKKLPVEVGSGIFDFETNTSIYRFRILTQEEIKLVNAAVENSASLMRGETAESGS